MNRPKNRPNNNKFIITVNTCYFLWRTKMWINPYCIPQKRQTARIPFNISIINFPPKILHFFLQIIIKNLKFFILTPKIIHIWRNIKRKNLTTVSSQGAAQTKIILCIIKIYEVTWSRKTRNKYIWLLWKFQTLYWLIIFNSNNKL